MWAGTNVTGAEFSGFEIKGGWDGIGNHGSGNTYKNNIVHDNWYTGIMNVSSSNVLIEGNLIYGNAQNCKGWPTANDISPRHCHDTYNANPPGYCASMKGNIIRNNKLYEATGLGVNFNGDSCRATPIEGTIIEGNDFLNTNTGVSMWHGTKGTIIRNNKFTIQNPPPSNMPVSLKCAIASWEEVIPQAMIDTNTFNLKSDYKKYCQY